MPRLPELTVLDNVLARAMATGSDARYRWRMEFADDLRSDFSLANLRRRRAMGIVSKVTRRAIADQHQAVRVKLGAALSANRGDRFFRRPCFDVGDFKSMTPVVRESMYVVGSGVPRCRYSDISGAALLFMARCDRLDDPRALMELDAAWGGPSVRCGRFGWVFSRRSRWSMVCGVGILLSIRGDLVLAGHHERVSVFSSDGAGHLWGLANAGFRD